MKINFEGRKHRLHLQQSRLSIANVLTDDPKHCTFCCFPFVYCRRRCLEIKPVVGNETLSNEDQKKKKIPTVDETRKLYRKSYFYKQDVLKNLLQFTQIARKFETLAIQMPMLLNIQISHSMFASDLWREQFQTHFLFRFVSLFFFFLNMSSVVIKWMKLFE